MFQTATIIVSAAALLSWLNFKFTRLPSTIGVMLISLIASIILIIFGETESDVWSGVTHLVSTIDFYAVVFHGMLPFLLFAGALHVKTNELRQEWLPVTLLAVVGTAVSILAVAGGVYFVFAGLGSNVPWIGCLLFGALISPTDPIAVLGIMKSAGASKSIETQIAGESLFNDGVGVVAFVTLLAVAAGETPPSVSEAAILLCREVGGAALVGGAVGGIALLLLRGVDRYQIEVLLTVAVALGSYALAEAVHASAPIAVVIAGLCVGNFGRAVAMSPQTKRRVDEFWELIDEFLNVVLFLLMGLEFIVLPHHPGFSLVGRGGNPHFDAGAAGNRCRRLALRARRWVAF